MLKPTIAHGACVRVYAPVLVPALAVGPKRPEQGPVDVGAMPGTLKIGAQQSYGLRVDRHCLAPAALARRAQRVIAAVLVQIARSLLLFAENADWRNGAFSGRTWHFTSVCVWHR